MNGPARPLTAGDVIATTGLAGPRAAAMAAIDRECNEPRVEHKVIKYADLPRYRQDGWAMIYDEWRRADGYQPLHVAVVERVAA